MSKIMLCADSVSVRYPKCLGLEEESLLAHDWIDVLSSAPEAREKMHELRPREVWVAGSDEMEAINLAAALKQAKPGGKVCLLAFKGSGSLYSRAQAAGIDEVWDKSMFLSQYRRAKHRGNKDWEVYDGRALSTEGVADVRQEREGAREGEDAQELIPDEACLSSKPLSAVQSPGLDMASPLKGTASLANEDEHAKSFLGIGEATAKPLSAKRDQISRLAAPAVERGHLLSVVGAGGGVGKSSVSVIAAYLAQGMGYNTVLVDADLQFGDIKFLTGSKDALPLDEACGHPARLESLRSNGRVPAILSAPRKLEQSEQVALKFADIVEKLRERFDCVVVNTSPAWADTHLSLLEAGGHALFLLDQRPSSIRSCKHAIQLCSRCGIAVQPIVFAINRCSRQSLFSSIDVSCALQGAHVVELAEGGRDVEEMLGTGAPLELIDSGNALCQSVARILADMLPKKSGASAARFAPARRKFNFGIRRKKAACL